MKKAEKQKRLIAETLSKITTIARHIRNVEDNCVFLGTKLIERGEIQLGTQLIANGYGHDLSKFQGIEFEHMSPTEPCMEEGAKLKLKLAVHHHRKTNPHHVEYWANGIREMPDVYLAEFCCDIKSRSEEFGTDLRQWIDETATKKWNFSKDDAVYKKIMKYVDILCPAPFDDLSK